MMKIPNFTSGSSQSVAKLNAFWRGLTILFAVVFTHLSSTLAAEQPAGLIIYMEPPVGSMKSVEPIRFAKFQRTSVAYSDVVLLDGKTREIANGGILAFFQLPNGNSQSQQAIQQQAAEIVRKYPSVRSSVEAFLGEFHQLEAAAQKAQTLSHAAPASPATSQKFTVGGITYAGVSLESVGTDSAKIMHSDGVANLPLASLSSEQIAFLNTTSSTVHIDPTWADKKKLAEARKPTAAAATASVIPSSTTPSIPTGSSVPPVTPTRSKSAKVVRPLTAMEAAVYSEEFGKLPAPTTSVEPSVEETVAFINAKLDATSENGGRAFQLGYIGSIQKWAVRVTLSGHPFEVVTFSFSDINPEKIILDRSKRDSGFGRVIEDDSVVLHCTNGLKKIETTWLTSNPPKHEQSSMVGIPSKDQFDMDKMGKALANLIHAYGGKAETF